MKNDLKNMSVKELEKLIADAGKALANAKSKERYEARKAAEQAAAKFGFSLDELTGQTKARRGRSKGPKANGTKGAPKYRNPANPDQTWTGKGRKPNWFIAEMDKGTPAEKLAV